MIFSVGQKSKDDAAMLQGAEMLIASGRADAATVGQFNMVAAQLAYNSKQYAKARTFLEGAIAAGYTENDPELLLAEAYFAENQFAPGLNYLSDKIAARKAAGQPVPEGWVKRGLAIAYNNKLSAEASRWALDYARDYPSEASWGDAISILINTNSYQPAEMLDLLRLARATNTIRTGGLYLEYVTLPIQEAAGRGERRSGRGGGCQDERPEPAVHQGGASHRRCPHRRGQGRPAGATARRSRIRCQAGNCDGHCRYIAELQQRSRGRGTLRPSRHYPVPICRWF